MQSGCRLRPSGKEKNGDVLYSEGSYEGIREEN